MTNQTAKSEEDAALLAAVEDFLDKNNLPRFFRGGEATLSVTYDNGKTFQEIGTFQIGDVRIDPPRPGDLR